MSLLVKKSRDPPAAGFFLDPTILGDKASNLDHKLKERVIGQDEAIAVIVAAYQTYLAGMNAPDRPANSFLFLGPTGSGKTRAVEALAESLVNDARAVIKIDCAEFQHSHEIAKLIGSPPGYLGHRETHPLLSQEVLNLHHTDEVKLSFVLFDEIEKASDALWNLLLGILDKAILTLGDNRRVDFSQSMIFMTSNLGAAEMASMLEPTLGFAVTKPNPLDQRVKDKITASGINAAKKNFTPEFMNRLDKIVVFHSLTEENIRQILDIELAKIQQRSFVNTSGAPFLFKLTDQAKGHLIKLGISDPKYGARHLKRAIERELVYPLSNLIASEQVEAGDVVRVDLQEDQLKLTFQIVLKNMPPYAMVEELGVQTAVTTNPKREDGGNVRAAGVRVTRR